MILLLSYRTSMTGRCSIDQRVPSSAPSLRESPTARPRRRLFLRCVCRDDVREQAFHERLSFRVTGRLEVRICESGCPVPPARPGFA